MATFKEGLRRFELRWVLSPKLMLKLCYVARRRTAMKPAFALSALALRSLVQESHAQAAFIALHAVFFLYAIGVYIGIRSMLQDFTLLWRKQSLPESASGRS